MPIGGLELYFPNKVSYTGRKIIMTCNEDE
jgi:hypothetical protein